MQLFTFNWCFLDEVLASIPNNSQSDWIDWNTFILRKVWNGEIFGVHSVVDLMENYRKELTSINLYVFQLKWKIRGHFKERDTVINMIAN